MTVFSRPLVWLGLLAMWLLLGGSLAPGQILLGAIVATLACWAALPLAPPRSRIRSVRPIPGLVAAVVKDVIRSNIAVLALILSGRTPRSAFVDIPLQLTDENGLAILACIITATPGSAWIQYRSRTNTVTVHVLDTPDAEAWAAEFKHTYERRLLEILK